MTCYVESCQFQGIVLDVLHKGSRVATNVCNYILNVCGYLTPDSRGGTICCLPAVLGFKRMLSTVLNGIERSMHRFQYAHQASWEWASES
jgi:hypothetical protein